MSTIVIAGAGHGGLVAAAQLANQGLDVCVYESKRKEELGHDWEDRFGFDLLLRLTENEALPDDVWHYRGDSVFVSPSKRTRVEIAYNDDNRHKLMWRKPLIEMLLDYAEKCGVKFKFETKVLAPIIIGDKVVGIKTEDGDVSAELVIDATGYDSLLRKALPEHFGIEKEGARGDAFYGYRAYFDKAYDANPEFPHEVYLYHECEQGLSWFCTNDDCVDVLIGRIDPLTGNKVAEQLDIFRKNHDWLGKNILHGGSFGTIPVRRPLSVMVADGYAAVGDSAFMTTPMNGMGIDLSMLAGELLANTILNCKDNFYSKENLWRYNRDYHKLYGGETAKNEGLKNALLNMSPEGVDFLFDNAIIQSSDLAGAGKNMKFSALIGKFIRGMKNPKYFFALLKGLIKGSKACKTLKKVPKNYDIKEIAAWQKKIEACVVKII